MAEVLYRNTITNRQITECELYDALMCGCSAKYYVKWKWENLTTHIIHTGREWKAIWAVSPPVCPPVTCSDPLCPTGRELVYLNIIENVTLDYRPNDLSVTLVDATYFTTGLPPVPDYILDWGDGSPTESILIGVPLTHDVSIMSDGLYTGNISWEGAVFQFWYEVSGGTVIGYQQTRTSTLVDYDLDCALYPDYPFSLSDTATVVGTTIDTAAMKVFGINQPAQPVGATAYTNPYDTTTDLQSGSSQIAFNYIVNVPTPVPIFNTALFTTDCIA